MHKCLVYFQKKSLIIRCLGRARPALSLKNLRPGTIIPEPTRLVRPKLAAILSKPQASLLKNSVQKSGIVKDQRSESRETA